MSLLAGAEARIREAWPRYRRPVRDALVIVGLLRAFVFFVVQGEHPWEFWGIDARAYWGIDLAHPYTHSGVGELSTYLYSPAFAQLMAPFSNLPFPVFFALWTTVSVAILVWLVRPWPWAVPMLLLPIVYELCVGNIHFLLAGAFVVALRAPVAWAFPLLTKITPGVGVGWFLVRREWRPFAIATGFTAAVVAVSFALNPSAWEDWIALLTSSPGRTDWLWARIAIAALLVVWGARTNRPWVIAVAGWLALPVIWINSWVMLLAVIRLREPPVETGMTSRRAVSPARFAARVVTVVLLAFALVEVLVVTDAIRSGTTTAIGIDIDQYLAHARRWLDSGAWYLPEQLAGPYVVEDVQGNMYPPPLLYAVLPFALGVPMVLWYAVPVSIIAFTYWRHRPAWWAWPILGLVLVYPRTWTVLLLGNPALWAIAFAVAGTQWGWPAWGSALKLTFAPLVFVGIRQRRAWLIGGAVAVLLAAPFAALWLDYITVLRNAASNRDLEYVLGEWPIALGLMVVAWSASRDATGSGTSFQWRRDSPSA